LLSGAVSGATLTSVRKLIVNADDFGMTRGINRAIAEAHDAGIVTSATLMAGSDAFDDAVEIAARRPMLRVGCHVVLVEGHPLAESSEVSSLLDPATRNNGTKPELRSSLANFARAATRGLIKAEHVVNETVAQIQKLQAAGIRVSHVDCHKHAHMFPRIAEAVIEGARRCGVSTIRAPFEPSWAVFAGGPGIFRFRLLIRSFQVTLLRRWHDPFRQMVLAAGMQTTDGTIGIALTGVLDQKFFNQLIERMPEGTFELVCHPGYNDVDLARVDTGLLASREIELKVLTSSETREMLARRDIELINFGELPVKS
jgi:chitin disaccharide deacetylase